MTPGACAETATRSTASIPLTPTVMAAVPALFNFSVQVTIRVLPDGTVPTTTVAPAPMKSANDESTSDSVAWTFAASWSPVFVTVSRTVTLSPTGADPGITSNEVFSTADGLMVTAPEVFITETGQPAFPSTPEAVTVNVTPPDEMASHVQVKV